MQKRQCQDTLVMLHRRECSSTPRTIGYCGIPTTNRFSVLWVIGVSHATTAGGIGHQFTVHLGALESHPRVADAWSAHHDSENQQRI